jgi:hypothetical protein
MELIQSMQQLTVVFPALGSLLILVVAGGLGLLALLALVLG